MAFHSVRRAASHSGGEKGRSRAEPGDLRPPAMPPISGGHCIVLYTIVNRDRDRAVEPSISAPLRSDADRGRGAVAERLPMTHPDAIAQFRGLRRVHAAHRFARGLRLRDPARRDLGRPHRARCAHPRGGDRAPSRGQPHAGARSAAAIAAARPADGRRRARPGRRRTDPPPGARALRDAGDPRRLGRAVRSPACQRDRDRDSSIGCSGTCGRSRPMRWHWSCSTASSIRRSTMPRTINT